MTKSLPVEGLSRNELNALLVDPDFSRQLLGMASTANSTFRPGILGVFRNQAGQAKPAYRTAYTPPTVERVYDRTIDDEAYRHHFARRARRAVLSVHSVVPTPADKRTPSDLELRRFAELGTVAPVIGATLVPNELREGSNFFLTLYRTADGLPFDPSLLRPTDTPPEFSWTNPTDAGLVTAEIPYFIEPYGGGVAPQPPRFEIDIEATLDQFAFTLPDA